MFVHLFVKLSSGRGEWAMRAVQEPLHLSDFFPFEWLTWTFLHWSHLNQGTSDLIPIWSNVNTKNNANYLKLHGSRSCDNNHSLFH